jgi:transcriptional regulator with XRE-family HTH domain
MVDKNDFFGYTVATYYNHFHLVYGKKSKHMTMTPKVKTPLPTPQTTTRAKPKPDAVSEKPKEAEPIDELARYTGAIIKRIQGSLRLSDKEIEGALQVDLRTIKRWIEGRNLPQRETRKRLYMLDAFEAHLLEVFETPQAAHQWLKMKCRYLSDLTPADAIRVGRIDRAEAALEVYLSGIVL